MKRIPLNHGLSDRGEMSALNQASGQSTFPRAAQKLIEGALYDVLP